MIFLFIGLVCFLLVVGAFVTDNPVAFAIQAVVVLGALVFVGFVLLIGYSLLGGFK